MSIADESSLIGPDVSDQPTVEIDCTGPDTWVKQFVNRWVFHPHQRPHAVKELMACLTEIRNGSDKQTANGTKSTGRASGAASAADALPTQSIAVPSAELLNAIRTLVVEFNLPSFVDIFRDDAKADPEYVGLSENHPRVQRFLAVCEVLRREAEQR